MNDTKLPLFIVTGASGVGKTTVMSELRKLLPDFDVFSTDDDLFGSVGAKLDYGDRHNLLLNIARSVAMSKRGSIICGTIMPWDVKKYEAYGSFDSIYFINLHCDDTTRDHRLRNREDSAMWNEEMLEQHREFAQWLLDNAETAYNPPMPTIDTTNNPPHEVAKAIKAYLLTKWNG